VKMPKGSSQIVGEKGTSSSSGINEWETNVIRLGVGRQVLFYMDVEFSTRVVFGFVPRKVRTI